MSDGEVLRKPPVPDYNALIKGAQKQAGYDLQQTMSGATQQKPDEFAHALRLAPKLGVTPEAMAGALRAARPGQVVQADTDYARLVQQSQATAKWLVDPHNAAIAHDDIPTLEAIEKALGPIRSERGFIHELWAAHDESWDRTLASYVHLLVANGNMTPQDGAHLAARLTRQANESKAQQPQWATEGEQAMNAAAQRTTGAVKKIGDASGLGYIDAILNAEDALELQLLSWVMNPRAAARKQLENASSTEIAIAGGIAGGTAGTIVGNPLGGVAAGTYLAEIPSEVGGWVEQRFQEMGIDTTDEAALLKAYTDTNLMTAVSEEAVRKGLVTPLFDAMGVLVGGKAVTRALGESVSKFAMGTVKDVALETAGEFAGEAAGQAAARKDISKVDWGEAVDEGLASLGQSIMQVGLSTVARRAGEPTASVGRKIKDAIQARIDTQSLDDANERVQESKVKERHHGRFQELVEVASEGDAGSVTEAHVDAAAWEKAFSKPGMSPSQAAEDVMKGGAKRYQDGRASGTITFPIGAFLDKVGASEQWKELLPNTRVRPDGKTLQEAADEIQAMDETIKATVQGMNDTADEAQELISRAKEIDAELAKAQVEEPVGERLMQEPIEPAATPTEPAREFREPTEADWRTLQEGDKPREDEDVRTTASGETQVRPRRIETPESYARWLAAHQAEGQQIAERRAAERVGSMKAEAEAGQRGKTPEELIAIHQAKIDQIRAQGLEAEGADEIAQREKAIETLKAGKVAEIAATEPERAANIVAGEQRASEIEALKKERGEIQARLNELTSVTGDQAEQLRQRYEDELKAAGRPDEEAQINSALLTRMLQVAGAKAGLDINAMAQRYKFTFRNEAGQEPAEIGYPRLTQQELAAVQQESAQIGKPWDNAAGLPVAKDADGLQNFWRWFGNSVAIDVHGRPLVVFHGTDVDVDFEDFMPWSHVGTSQAANDRLRHRFATEGRRVLPLYISLQNPLKVPDLGGWDAYEWKTRMQPHWPEELKQYINEQFERWRNAAVGLTSANVAEQTRAFRKQFLSGVQDILEREGYDGLAYQNEAEDVGSISYVAFRPSQLKSAIGNQGGFRTDRASILEQRGEPVEQAWWFSHAGALHELSWSALTQEERATVADAFGLPPDFTDPESERMSHEEYALAFAERLGVKDAGYGTLNQAFKAGNVRIEMFNGVVSLDSGDGFPSTPKIRLAQKAFAALPENVQRRTKRILLSGYPASISRDSFLTAKSHNDFQTLFQGPLVGEPGSGAPFYSQALKVVTTVSREQKLPPKKWLDKLRGSGVKQDEIYWSGLQDWMAMQGKSISQQDMETFLRNGGVQIEEFESGGIAGKPLPQGMSVEEFNRAEAQAHAAMEHRAQQLYDERKAVWQERVDNEVQRREERGDPPPYLTTQQIEDEDGKTIWVVEMGPEEGDDTREFATAHEAELFAEKKNDERIGEYEDDIRRQVESESQYRWDEDEEFEQATQDAMDQTELPDDSDAEWSQYALKGGRAYGTLRITFQATKPPTYEARPAPNGDGWAVYMGPGEEGMSYGPALSEEQAREIAAEVNAKPAMRTKQEGVMSHAFDERNIVVWVRHQVFKDKDGKDVLMIEEIQSDWAQKGHKQGFRASLSESLQLGKKKADAQRALDDYVDKTAEKWGFENIGGHSSRLWNRLNEIYTQTPIDEITVRKVEPQVSRELGDHEGGFMVMSGEKQLAGPYVFREDAQESADGWRQLQAKTYGEVKTDKIGAAFSDLNTLNKLQKEAGVAEEAANKATQGSPRGPFVTETPAWVGLALKRMVRYAAEHGIAKIAWTTGEQQVDRYPGLSELVDTLQWSEPFKSLEDDKVHVRLYGQMNDREVLHGKSVPLDDMADWVGPHIADKIMASQGKQGMATGEDIRVNNNPGIVKFYDEVVGEIAKGTFKKYGAKIETTELPDAYRQDNSPESPNEVVHSMEITPAMKESALAGEPLFQEGEGPHGSIGGAQGPEQPGGGRALDIAFYKTANPSTFVHELGHAFLAIMGDMAQQADASDQVREDYAGILKWLGAKAGEPLTTAQHEKWARGFEKYLSEGKAPTPALRRMFAQFAAWLVGVYRDLRKLKVDLTPEVREIMDRMVATEDEIEAAKAELGGAPVFTEKPAEWTDEQWAQYQADQQAAIEVAQAKLNRALQAEVSRAARLARQERVDQVAKRIAPEFEELPPVRALKALQGTGPGAFKLDRASVEGLYGPGGALTKRLADMGVLADKGGQTAQEAAEAYGMGSGDQFCREVEAATRKDQAIQARARAIVKAENPELMGTPKLRALAKDALQNAESLKVQRDELNALRKMAATQEKQVETAEDKLAEANAALREEKVATKVEKRVAKRAYAAIPPLKVIRARAEAELASKQVRHIKPSLFLRNMSRESKTAAKEYVAGATQLAAEAKAREIYNRELYRIATRILAQAEKDAAFGQRMSTPAKQEQLGKLGGNYLPNMNAILEHYSFRRESGPAIEKRRALEAFIKEREAEGRTPDIDPAILDDAAKRNYRELTGDQLHTVREAMEQIDHLARTKDKLLTIHRRREYQKSRDALVAQITSSGMFTERPRGSKTRKQKLADKAGNMYGAHMKIAILARIMDGVRDLGPVLRTLVTPLNDAATLEEKRQGIEGDRLSKIFGLLPDMGTKEFTRARLIPGTQLSLSHEDILGTMLHRGNKKGSQRVSTRYSEAEMTAMEDTLDENDVKFLNAMWAYHDSFWSEIADKWRRIRGVAPTRDEAVPRDVKSGHLNGGFHKRKYSDRKAYQVDLAEQASLAKRGAFSASMSRHGYAEEALDEVKDREIRVDLGVIFEHVNELLHDLTHHEALSDVGRFLRDKKVVAAMDAYHGEYAIEQFRSALEDIAAGTQASRARDESIAKAVRGRVSDAQLAFKALTSVVNMTGLTQSFRRIGVGYVLRGFSRWGRNSEGMLSTIDWIYENSDFMKQRPENFHVLLTEMRNRLDKSKNPVWREYAYTLMQLTQTFVDVPTWLGAYEKAMDQGHEHEAAVEIADQAVRDTQGSGQMVDLAKIQRGDEWKKLFTTFYFYASTTFGQVAETVSEYRQSEKHLADKAKIVVGMMLMFTLPAVMKMAMEDALRGEDDDDEDFQAWLKRKLKRLAAEHAAGLLDLGLISREFSGIFKGVDDYGGSAGTRLIGDTYKLAAQVMQGEADDALRRALIQVAGSPTGLPAAQINATWDGIEAIADGRVRGWRAITAPIFGAPRRAR